MNETPRYQSTYVFWVEGPAPASRQLPLSVYAARYFGSRSKPSLDWLGVAPDVLPPSSQDGVERGLALQDATPIPFCCGRQASASRHLPLSAYAVVCRCHC